MADYNSDDDEDLKRAIALSLQDAENELVKSSAKPMEEASSSPKATAFKDMLESSKAGLSI